MRFRLAIGAAVAAGACAVALTGTAAAAPQPPLGHEGRWITDSSGRVVILHGLNMVYKLAPYTPAAAGFGRDDARFLARHGFNTVRLGVIYAGLEPRPGVIDDDYLASIAHTQRVLARQGIYSLIDFHQDLYNERFQGEGFPDWAVQDDGLPALPKLGFPGNYFAMTALWRAYDHFWANARAPDGTGLQDHYAAAFRATAERFAQAPHVLGYDLFNEPFPGSPWLTCANPVGCPLLDASLLGRFSTRVIAQIRRADPTTLAFYEPWVTFDFGARTSLPDTGDPQAAMSFHDYCLPAGIGLGGLPASSDGCRVEEDLVFQNAEAQARRTGDALLLTEFGATDDLQALRRVTGLADDHMVGWQEWHYCACGEPTSQVSADTQALVKDATKPPRGDNVKTAKLQVLDRPYPQAVAGTPLGYSYDPGADVFRLRYSARLPSGGVPPPGAETEIYLPPLHYPGGYDVELSGGRVVSEPGARILRIERAPGASTVTVTVTAP